MMADDKYWITDNLEINVAGSYCYDELDSNCELHGRLYTWEAAREACSHLGNGWLLPTNEQWRQMVEHYGGVGGDSDSDGKAAYYALVNGGNAGFNALLGGGRDADGSFRRIDAHGFYWTASPQDAGSAWFYNFGKGSLALYRQEGGDKAVCHASSSLVHDPSRTIPEGCIWLLKRARAGSARRA